MVLTAVSLHFSYARTGGDGSLVLGNCRENVVGYLPAASEGEKAGFALYYPAERMQAYRGCAISDICVNINYLSGMNPIRLFVTSELDGAPLYEQSFMPVRNGWTTVRLDTPFELDGSALYIGYEVTGLKYITYSLPLVEGEQEWVRRKSGSWELYDDGHSAALYAIVSSESLPANDVKLEHVIMPGYATTGTPLRYDGEFVNLGTSAVSSLQFTYHVGDMTHVETVDGLDVAPRAAGTFSLSGLAINSAGDHDVRLEVSAVNGDADAAPYDNFSRATTVVCRDSFTARKVLMEVFSTELCTSCPSAHRIIESVMGDKHDVIEIGHHAGFYTDWLTINESSEYEWFYREYVLYAPAVMFDRTADIDNYPALFSDGVPVTAPNGTNLPLLYDCAASVPAFVSVDIEADLDAASRRLEVRVSGDSLLPASAPDPRLFVFLTEDSIYTTTQAGASSGFYHRFAVRRSLTPTWGTPVSLSEGYEAGYTVDLPDEWNMANVRVVAFVANYDDGDKTNCRVLNAGEVELASLLPSAVASVRGDGLPLLSFESGRLSAPRGFDSLTVSDLSGRRVVSFSSGDATDVLASVPAGAYVVSVSKGTENMRVKVIIPR